MVLLFFETLNNNNTLNTSFSILCIELKTAAQKETLSSLHTTLRERETHYCIDHHEHV